ncbi:HNH endonuclease signature motif containing protein [Microbacterium sp. MMO-10]|uniref:HNH endonuclease signature motif containing protein n=1 Tax=Microbacterium sp. MMO-10 TaxID=3081272 RepID=UPI0030170E7B
MTRTADSYLVRSDEIVDRCRELDRRIAALEAEKSALLGQRVQLLLDEVPPGAAGFESAERSMFAEVAAALHISRAAASRALATGWSLGDRFPQTRAALATGEISLRHAAVIVAGAAALDLADRDAHARYEGLVVPYAAAETAPRTEAFARSAAASVAPETVVERHRRARADRQVRVTDAEDGMAWLEILLPSPLAHAAYDRVSAIGRQLRVVRAAQDCGAFSGPRAPQPGQAPTDDDWRRLTSFESIVDELQEPLTDPRSLDELRADIVSDLLLTADTDLLTQNGVDGIRATVQVTIAASTLAGADDRPAELDGHGPIDPDIARALAGGAGTWDRLFLDPRGMLTRTDTYAPTERMRRLLRARDRHCRFPGCRMPARSCDLDHNHDHALGGPTDLCNLCCLCEGHHALKHPDLDDRWRWTAAQGPGGVITWTSPGGRIYADTPPPRVQFV